MKESEIVLFAFLIFIHPCKIIIPKIKKIIGKRVSHHVLQEIYCKKANATNNGLFYPQLKMLVMQQSTKDLINYMV